MTEGPAALRPAVFEILLLLSERDWHGYGLMQEIKSRSRGRWILGPGTLYRTLKQMRDDGLIELAEASEEDAAEGDGPRRRDYRLTGHGREVAGAEAARMRHLVERARQGSLISRTEPL
jgi:DNA-binding PadR family transcriptional regulator